MATHVYLVRLIDDKDIVGLFCVGELSLLEFHVDECADPNICEYLKLTGNGGIIWPHSPAPPVGVEAFSDDEDDYEPIVDVGHFKTKHKVQFSQYWYEAIHTDKYDKRWKPVVLKAATGSRTR